MAKRDAMLEHEIRMNELGRIQRNLTKVMEDLCVQYDGTVRNGGGDVIQFIYGEDGLFPSLEFDQRLEIARMDDSRFRIVYRLSPEKMTMQNHVIPSPFSVNDDFPSLADYSPTVSPTYSPTSPPYLPSPSSPPEPPSPKSPHPILLREFYHLEEDRQFLRSRQLYDTYFLLPCRIKDIIERAQLRFSPPLPSSDLSYLQVAQSVSSLLSKHPNASFGLLEILVRSELASKRVVDEYMLSKIAFNWVLDEINSSITKSLIHPGEPVGVLAAQAIKPANPANIVYMFRAGYSFKDMLVDIPRLKELIYAKTNLDIPTICVYLKENMDPEHAKQVQQSLKVKTLRSILLHHEIIHDPDPSRTKVREDEELVQLYMEMPDDIEPSLLSSWVIRLELDRKLPLLLGDVVDKIRDEADIDMQFIYSDENDTKLVVRIRLIKKEEEEEFEYIFIQEIASRIIDIQLCGLSGIESVCLFNI